MPARRGALLGENRQRLGAAPDVLRRAHDALGQPVAAAFAEADLAQELGQRVFVVPLQVEALEVALAVQNAALDALEHPAQ